MSNIIEFTAPPLPHFIMSGLAALPPGGKHPSRKNIGAFDLLVVRKGTLFVGEEGKDYVISEGHALILRPDCHHYAYEGCPDESAHYWLHFQLLGDWKVINEYPAAGQRLIDHESKGFLSPDPFEVTPYSVFLPQFTKLVQPQKMFDTLHELDSLNQSTHMSSARLKQQALFQEIIMLLSASLEAKNNSPQSACAEKAAIYLKAHYREPFSASRLGEAINFHPVYIARCMHNVFGCSPSAYLLRFRIDQAKLLLLQTDWPVERIAEEVGFNQAAYFTSSFTRIEGLAPRKYRQRFSWNRG